MAIHAGYYRNGRTSRNGSAKPPREQAGDAPEPAQARDELDRRQIKALEQELLELKSKSYKPNLPIYNFRDENFDQISFYYDIEAMLRHDCIWTPLDYVKAPILQMQIAAEASSTRVLKYLLAEWDKFKQNWLPRVQDSSYPYGWMGGEPVYEIEGGLLVQSDFRDFSPRDVVPLILRNQVVGIQLSNTDGGALKLGNGSSGIPAKGFWYPHRPQYGSHFGHSQIRGAWKPWRRLAGRDGVEEVTDLDCYRSGTGVVVVGAPLEDTAAKHQTPGLVRQPARDVAQELAENLKAGAGVVLPTTVDVRGNRKWTLDFEAPRSNLDQLLKADEALYKKCSKAIGFPPELLEAADTGSGFSGRMIPLHAFLMNQQSVAQALFFAWFKQIGKPLIWWNFGKKHWCRPKVIPLLQSYRTASIGQQPGAPATPQPGPAMPAPGGAPPGLPASGQTPGMPAPGGAGAPAKIPYLGPRGGKGYRDMQGRVHYTQMLSTGSYDFSEAYRHACRAVAHALQTGDARRAGAVLRKYADHLEPDEIDALIAAVEMDAQTQAA